MATNTEKFGNDDVLRIEHHKSKSKVQDWWKQNDDITAKKLRREKNKNTNPNKRNKIILGSGKRKRFYTEPVMSWTDLVSKEQPKDEKNDDVMIEDEESQSSEDGFSNFDRNNTNFEKFKGFDYGEIDFEDGMDGFNQNDDGNEDIECDESEEDKNGEFEMLDIEKLDNENNKMEMEMDEIGKKDKKQRRKNDIFDEDGLCKLTLNDNDCLFYRHEANDNDMWKHWNFKRRKFQKARFEHKEWALRRQERKQIDKMLGDKGNTHSNKKAKKRKLRDI